MAFAKVQNCPDIALQGAAGHVLASNPFAQGVGVGNTVIGFVVFNSASPDGTLSVVDNLSVAQNTLVFGQDTIVGGDWLSAFWMTNVQGGPTTYTVTAGNVTDVAIKIWVEEYSGFGAGATRDGGTAFANPLSSATANNNSSGNITTASAGSFVWSGSRVWAGGIVMSAGTSPAYTINLANNNPTQSDMYTEWYTQPAAGNIAGIWNANTGGTRVGMAVMAITQGVTAPTWPSGGNVLVLAGGPPP